MSMPSFLRLTRLLLSITALYTSALAQTDTPRLEVVSLCLGKAGYGSRMGAMPDRTIGTFDMALHQREWPSGTNLLLVLRLPQERQLIKGTAKLLQLEDSTGVDLLTNLPQESDPRLQQMRTAMKQNFLLTDTPRIAGSERLTYLSIATPKLPAKGSTFISGTIEIAFASEASKRTELPPLPWKENGRASAGAFVVTLKNLRPFTPPSGQPSQDGQELELADLHILPNSPDLEVIDVTTERMPAGTVYGSGQSNSLRNITVRRGTTALHLTIVSQNTANVSKRVLSFETDLGMTN